MNPKKVLVISHAQDNTANMLCSRLSERNQPFSLIDLGLFPDESSGTISFQDNVPVRFRQGGEYFDSTNVSGIWWRRPHGKGMSSPSNPLESYVGIECDIFIRSLFYLLPDVTWVSDPESTRIANSKPLQLKTAKELGLRIPRTIISNDPIAVKQFIRDGSSQKLTMKPVGSSYFKSDFPDSSLSIYTRILDPQRVLDNIEMTRNCPIIVQEAIAPKLDLRITVVGTEVFPVSITHDRDNGAGVDNLDWRNHKLERIYRPYNLPHGVSDQCIQLTRKLGLTFGAIDMCVSPDGQYYFFEINPQGQWVPSELVAGHPISSSLARLLTA